MCSCRGSPSAWEVNETICPEISQSNEIAGLRKLFQFSERLMTIRSVDELLESLLDSAATGRVRRLYNGVDLDHFHNGDRKEAGKALRHQGENG